MPVIMGMGSINRALCQPARDETDLCLLRHKGGYPAMTLPACLQFKVDCLAWYKSILWLLVYCSECVENPACFYNNCTEFLLPFFELRLASCKELADLRRGYLLQANLRALRFLTCIYKDHRADKHAVHSNQLRLLGPEHSLEILPLQSKLGLR